MNEKITLPSHLIKNTEELISRTHLWLSSQSDRCIDLAGDVGDEECGEMMLKVSGFLYELGHALTFVCESLESKESLLNTMAESWKHESMTA